MTYTMSDIHGFYDRYDEMLRQINFSDQDTLIINGDVADRGPDGIKIYQDIMARENVVLVMGNHEKMFLDTVLACTEDELTEAVSLWFHNGGEVTWDAYCELPVEERRKLIAFIARCETTYETTVGDKQFYFVHGFPAESTMDKVWNRPDIRSKSDIVPEGSQLIIGHTPVFMFHHMDGTPLKIEHAEHFIDLDCGCGQNIEGVSRLACLRLDDMQEFYV